MATPHSHTFPPSNSNSHSHSLASSAFTPLPTSPSKSHHHHNYHRRKPSKRSIVAVIAMSSFLALLISLIVIFAVPSSSRHHGKTMPHSDSPLTAQIQQACKATRNPNSCESSLTQHGRLGPDPSPVQIINSAIAVSSDNLRTAQSMAKSILDSSVENPNRTRAAKTCLRILSYSDYRASSAGEALTRGKTKNARAWMSAALAYQYDCWSGLKYVNGTKLVGDTMSFLDTLIGYTSNALSMMVSYDNFGNDVASWVAPKTERDGFWERGGSETSEPAVGLPSGLTADVTVCKEGGGRCYKTVQDAVNAAPENATRRFVIRIEAGVYEETVRVPFEKRNVVFLGDGMGKTVITGSLNVGQLGMTTYESATVGVLGDGFMAKDLTIQNTAGPDAHQAVAFRSDSDFSVIENCEFLGNQDTLYAHSLRQLYKSCRIQGNVDFIFGNSASVFQDCQILVAPRQLNPEKGENNAITAHGRTDPAQSTGFVFVNCSVNGTEEYMKLYHSKPKAHRNYLGRPWKEFSRTVFIGCNLEALISPEGWMPWSGDFALKTLYYGEYKNSGLGSDVTHRVPWSSQVPEENVNLYSVQNFIQGDEWMVTSS